MKQKRETRLILVRNSWPSTALPVDEQIEFHAESYNYPKSVPLGYKKSSAHYGSSRYNLPVTSSLLCHRQVILIVEV